MVFKKISVGGICYGDYIYEDNYKNCLQELNKVNNVDFNDPLFFAHLKDNSH